MKFEALLAPAVSFRLLGLRDGLNLAFRVQRLGCLGLKVFRARVCRGYRVGPPSYK